MQWCRASRSTPLPGKFVERAECYYQSLLLVSVRQHNIVSTTHKHWQILIDPHTVELDINHYIQITLEQKLEDESLRLSDPSIILTIQSGFDGKGTGDVSQNWCSHDESWLICSRFSMGCLPSTEHLCAQRTDWDIIKALEDLPEDLPQIFERILRSLLQTNDIKFASRIFNWLAVAKRLLTLEELREAIAIQPRKTEFDAAYLVNDITQTLICCGCLVFVDEEQETVHFTRHSVKQYLLQRSSDPLPSDYHVEIEVADTYAGETCITYLSFDVFDRRIAKASSSGAKLVDIPAAVVRQRVPYSTLTRIIAALSFLRNRDTLDRFVYRQLEENTDKAQQQHPFLLYAKEWWILHTKCLEPTSKRYGSYDAI